VPARESVELEAEAKSGTHVRVPHSEQVLLPQDHAREPELPTPVLFYDDDLLSELEIPTAQFEPDASQQVTLIASWIDEEVIEIDGATPIEFLSEPPPLPPAALGLAWSEDEAAPRDVVPAELVHADPVPVPVSVDRGAQASVQAPVEARVQTVGIAEAIRGTEPEPEKLELLQDGESELASEPIRTRTMAKLLAGHGYKSRALAIYDHLIERAPNDASLRAEAAALRNKKK